MSVHAFLDESKRGSYLVCSVTLGPPLRSAVRSALSAMLKGGERALHMKDERDDRKKQILDALADLGVRATVFSSRQRPVYTARAIILREGVWPTLREAGADRLVMETGGGQDERDRRTLYELTHRAGMAGEFSYVHQSAAAEPLLSVPDAIVWAHGKGGDWSRRVAPLLAGVVDLDAR